MDMDKGSDKKKLGLIADPSKVLPKLCTRIVSERVDGNIVLTFLYDVNDENAQIVERIVISDQLGARLEKILQKEVSNE